MCAAVLKHWREAATAILVHQRRPAIQNIQKNGVKPKTKSPDTEQTTVAPMAGGLEMLVMKRSSRSSFMPDLYVFPGGTADDADFSREWMDIFRAATPEKKEERFGFVKTLSENAPMFSRQREAKFSSIPSEIAFRICALRETFEESGVLIARKGESLCSYKQNFSPCEAFNFGQDHASELEEWRQKVTSEPTQFLQLCKKYDIVPDVWSMFDWSDWLTPIGDPLSSKRFDAAFFICCLEEKPHVAEDASELVHFQWSSPQEMISENRQGKVQLAPPQLYEAHRLLNFSSADDLMNFLRRRVGQPMERWMPVRVQCADAVLFLFPGDSLYPSEPDIYGVEPALVMDKTLEELEAISPKRHRGVRQPPPKDSKPGSRPKFTLECNVQPRFGHVKPVL
ncbi:hypothetical protein BaRGS_00011071 [Batillaria attramentaria]|uniref:Nudix hydrolase domain-containing protein n=1 Tax=Batillaria attramentaria TaxID=370345 RepID=A0ABD0LEB6_9CAEN